MAGKADPPQATIAETEKMEMREVLAVPLKLSNLVELPLAHSFHSLVRLEQGGQHQGA